MSFKKWQKLIAPSTGNAGAPASSRSATDRFKDFNLSPSTRRRSGPAERGDRLGETRHPRGQFIRGNAFAVHPYRMSSERLRPM